MTPATLHDSLPERFTSKVRVDDAGCWVWTATITNRGYGQYSVRKPGAIHMTMASAHRFAYEAVHGPIAEGLHIDHLCRNRACVNPAHLEPVTAQVNLQRGDRTKLTPGEVTAIRESDATPKDLAEQYGVSPQQIRTIRRGDSWANVEVVDETGDVGVVIEDGAVAGTQIAVAS